MGVVILLRQLLKKFLIPSTKFILIKKLVLVAEPVETDLIKSMVVKIMNGRSWCQKKVLKDNWIKLKEITS